MQGAVWSAGARTWADIQEPQQSPFYEAAFDAIGVGENTNLLDAGCGAGLAMERARARGAEVSGFDASPGLLAIAKERMPLVDLRQGDIENLPYDDDQFDAVTAFNAVQFAETPANAVQEIKRVCKPGGKVALVSWAPANENDMRVILDALAPLMPDPPPGINPPSPFALSERGDLEDLMATAGLDVGEPIELPVVFTYPEHDTALRGMVATGPGMLAVNNAGEDLAQDTLGEAFQMFVTDDGSVVLNNKFRVVPATA
jgi:SAM-dependent methyltransferase